MWKKIYVGWTKRPLFIRWEECINTIKLNEFSPKYLWKFFPVYFREYFLKFGEINLNIVDNFQATMWNISPIYFGEYFPKISNFPKLLWKFPIYIFGEYFIKAWAISHNILGNISQTFEIFRNFYGILLKIF